ncbi:MAG: hypothetical protein ACXVPK_03350 [Tumebacillaceae bacterium]
MVVSLFLAIAWLLVILGITLPSKLDRREAFLIFMVILDIHISVSWVLVLEVKRVVVSEQVPQYFAYLIRRTVFVPMMALLFTNLLLFCRSFGEKVLSWLAYGGIWLLFEKLSLVYGIFTFPKWGYLQSLMLYYPYLIVSVYLLKWYRAYVDQEVRTR